MQALLQLEAKRNLCASRNLLQIGHCCICYCYCYCYCYW